LIYEVLLTAKNTKEKIRKGRKEKKTKQNKISFKMSLELKKNDLRTRNADF